MQPRPTNVAMMFVEEISPHGHDFGTRTPGGNSSLQTAIPLDPAPVSAPLLKRPRLCPTTLSHDSVTCLLFK
ncbi:uncharacterized protein PADG_00058 [Paracoccidioides brasiliensis Pb18]|uniref:Uncharacterized protein n=1 Tax=Paracoccidioides brasiliensis (strain Pb18) TaxID=502780 RepID=C1FZL8_PARBD|nr:uncharacterized protein PADG_00058 [Paracoccidioides brasiliensis Pb18]EEH43769.2 hypothetical protein PADG_00058 [Paracoccidioides brasiliensis Pb18]